MVAVTPSILLLLAAVGTAQAGPVLELEDDGAAVNNSTGTAQAIPSAAFTTPVPPTVFLNATNDPNDPEFPTATIEGRAGAPSDSPSFPSPDVDFYSFTGSGRVYLDIDDIPFTFDTIVSLFNSDGTLIALSDDSFPVDPGSENFFDSFLGVFTLPGPGTYFAAVTEIPNFPAVWTSGSCTPSNAPLTRPDGELGGEAVSCPPGETFGLNAEQPDGALAYTLHISLENPTPSAVPEPASLVLLGSGLAALAGAAWRRNRQG